METNTTVDLLCIEARELRALIKKLKEEVLMFQNELVESHKENQKLKDKLSMLLADPLNTVQEGKSVWPDETGV